MARIPRIERSRNISNVAEAPPASGLGFAALADIAQMGADFLKPAAIENAKIEGGKSVYRDENGQLQVDTKNVLGGDLAAVHNATAHAKYLATRKMDMRANFTELATKFEFDPAGFEDAARSYIATMAADESVPPVLRDDLMLTAQDEASRRFNGLYVQQNARTQRESDRETATHRDMLSDDYVNLVMQGDMEGAAKVYAEIESVSRYRSAADYISETDAEREAYLRGVRGAARAAQITQEISDLDSLSSITDERREEIQGLLDDPDISPAVRQRLYGVVDGKLKGIDGRAIAASLGATDVSAAVRNHGFRQPPAEHSTTIEYAMGPRRPNAPDAPVMGVIGSAVEDVLGAGARVVVTSGQEGDLPQHGSGRHKTGNAADIAIYAPDGTQIMATDPRMAEIARAAARQGAIGIGFGSEYMGGAHVHIDLVEPDPAQGQDYVWGSGAKAMRDELVGIISGNQVDYAGNRASLESAGVAITPGAEFLAAISDAGTASLLYSVDASVDAATLLPPEVVDANPALKGMTVGEARAWAERRGVVKASDIAARRTQVDMIEDVEVRDIALSALNDLYRSRQRLEAESAAEYAARVEANDSSLTEREIAGDHNLSDQDQASLVDELRRARKDQREIQDTLSDLSNDAMSWDMYDSGQRGDVDKAFKSVLGDEAPLSEQGMMLAAQIGNRTGFVPQSMFNALRGAVNGGDPEALASAMEFAGQMLDMQPGAFAPFGGRNEVIDALSDYQFYSGLMSGPEAAARMVEARAEPAPRNVSDQAKDLARDLSPDHVIDFMASKGVSVTLGTPAQEGAVMADYDRLFRDAFARTGDEDLARNRALAELSRVYGPNTVTGDSRLMRFPPQNFYPNVIGKPNWMQEQIAMDVSEYVYGDEARGAPSLVEGIVEGMAMGPINRIPPNRITLTSDERTRQDVASGKPPTYAVSYMDDDDMLQVVPGRYEFTPPAPTQMDIPTLDRSRRRAQANQIQGRINRDALQRGPAASWGSNPLDDFFNSRRE